MTNPEAPTTEASFNETLAHCVRRFDEIRRREEAELQKLCTDPEIFDVCQALTDRFFGDLSYLCNYKAIIGGNGKTYDIQEAISRIQDDFRKSFKAMTGKDYVPDTVRNSSKR